MNNSRRLTRMTTLAGVALIAGCAGTPDGQHAGGHGGGYYQNDGPPANTDIDLSQYPRAIPKKAPRSKYGNPSSYTALGKRYYVLKSAAGFTQTGRASWYGRQFSGGRTSSGAPYNMFAMTAAHKRLPIPTWVRVTNLDNHKQVIVKINDRGPFHKGRIIDLSYLAARRLGIVGQGSAPVRIQTVTPGDFRQAGATSSDESDRGAQVPLRSAANSAEHAAGADTAQRPKTKHTAQSATRQAAASNSAAANRPGVEYQIGAFSSAAHAARAKTRARTAGVKRVTIIAPTARMTLYRVRAGPFHKPAVRHRARQQLADAGFPAREVKR